MLHSLFRLAKSHSHDDLLTETQAIDQLRALWKQGVAYERNFWRNWLETNGSLWPEDYVARLDPTTEPPAIIAQLLSQQRLARPPRLLDVGAGPISCVGQNLAGAKIDITAVDPLAPIYDELLKRFSVTPLVRTKFAPAEALATFLPPSWFDLVHCRNALDHSINPLRGIVEMLRVTRVGGSVVLSHARNEAETEQYSGFHQWNFDIEEGKFVIWNSLDRSIVDSSLPVECSFAHHREGNWVQSIIVKIGEFDPVSEPDVAKQRAWQDLMVEVVRSIPS